MLYDEWLLSSLETIAIAVSEHINSKGNSSEANEKKT